MWSVGMKNANDCEFQVFTIMASNLHMALEICLFVSCTNVTEIVCQSEKDVNLSKLYKKVQILYLV